MEQSCATPRISATVPLRSTGPSLAYLAAGSDKYENGLAARRIGLRMSPVDASPTVSLRSALRRRRPGITWALVGPDGVQVAIRARDFPDVKSAHRDALQLRDSALELTPVPVGDDEGRRSWWLALRGEVVLVSTHSAAPSSLWQRAMAAITGLRRSVASREDREEAGGRPA